MDVACTCLNVCTKTHHPVRTHERTYLHACLHTFIHANILHMHMQINMHIHKYGETEREGELKREVHVRMHAPLPWRVQRLLVQCGEGSAFLLVMSCHCMLCKVASSM